MRFAILCLGLLLTTPAAANSVEEALCGASQVSVPSMSHSEKLCRAFTLSLAELPSATAAEMGALLTPESLATMVAVTSVWLGTQGIPVVGQAVDAALLLFGATMVGIMSADIAKALWAFANQTIEARTEDDLKQAASSLAWAVSKTTVTIVAFVLTKKAFGKSPTTRPPPPPRGPALVTAEGTVVSEMGVATSRADVRAPAAVAVFSQATGRPSGSRAQSFAPKKVDSKRFSAWISKFPKRPASNKSPASQYQVRHAGPDEIKVSGGSQEVWADGARARDARLLETKHVEKPDTSPYVPGSTCDDAVRGFIRNELLNELRRYAAVILDPATPAVELELITNEARAVPFFEALMKEVGAPGRVVIRP